MDQNTRRVEKGQKMDHAEAIQTRVLDFQRYHCLSALASEGFFPGGALGDFPKFFRGVPKVVEFGCS